MARNNTTRSVTVLKGRLGCKDTKKKKDPLVSITIKKAHSGKNKN